MEAIEVLVATDTVKLMALALVIVAITVLLGIRLMGQALKAFNSSNENWNMLIENMSKSMSTQTAATESLIEAVSVASKSYDELARKVEHVNNNHDILVALKEQIEATIQAAGVIDDTILVKLDEVLKILKEGKGHA